MAIVDANATVVVNIFTLEIAVEDINTEGEAKGLKTVEGINPAPHIHEQMTTSNYV